MRKRRTPPPSALTDIAFLLLLFFLILAVTTQQLPFDITLAEQEGTEINTEDIPSLFMNAEGVLYTDNGRQRIEDIPYSPSYVLIADKGTPFGAISPVIEHLRTLGVETLHAVVEEP